jgi:2-dehydro-3-deoxygalactonokinase
VVARAAGNVPRAGATALIAIDWGTTAARAYRLDARGAIVGERAAALGVQKVEQGRFSEALARLLNDGDPDDAPMIACGMIGSRQGWIEAPYLDCPVRFDAVASRLACVPDAALAIVPGLICRDADGVPDVMRGEETQILGAIEELAGPQCVVLPGTHSKWALVDGQGVAAFATFMTGELYAVLREHSILGRLAAPAEDAPAFDRGVKMSLRRGSALPHDLFSARTLALTGELAPTGVADYLSGLLIGAEAVAARDWMERQASRDRSIILVGEAMLCERYRRALALAGLPARTGPAHAAARGLWRIALHAGIVK